jgi:hypothetical protein
MIRPSAARARTPGNCPRFRLGNDERTYAAMATVRMGRHGKVSRVLGAGLSLRAMMAAPTLRWPDILRPTALAGPTWPATRGNGRRIAITTVTNTKGRPPTAQLGQAEIAVVVSSAAVAGVALRASARPTWPIAEAAVVGAAAQSATKAALSTCSSVASPTRSHLHTLRQTACSTSLGAHAHIRHQP